MLTIHHRRPPPLSILLTPHFHSPAPAPHTTLSPIGLSLRVPPTPPATRGRITCSGGIPINGVSLRSNISNPLGSPYGGFRCPVTGSDGLSLGAAHGCIEFPAFATEA